MRLSFSSGLRGSVRWAACLAGVALLGGCSAEPIYEHVQKEDGYGMKAPITFTVRVRVDKSTKTVAWVQDAVDAHGLTDRQIRTYGQPPFSACEIFDDANWSCEDRVNGDLVERPEMRDGRLSRFYFSGTADYKKSHKVLGMTL